MNLGPKIHLTTYSYMNFGLTRKSVSCVKMSKKYSAWYLIHHCGLYFMS